jgi:7-cyano-7-deazaguanine synthase in queuosine biosynthesis
MKAHEFDYTFSFEPIQNQSTQVTQYTHLKDKRDLFTVSINDRALSINGLSTVPSLSADLLDLAIAIHAIDRLIKRPTETPLGFRIELPVRNFEIFTRSDVYDLLTKILEWYTGDCWHFEFSKREAFRREVEVQPQLPWINLPKEIEVALWSGGLDSLSGLYTQLINNPENHHFLIGTGSNSSVHKRQKKIADVIEQNFPKRTFYIQVPYHWQNTPSRKKNFNQRSRGLVFILIGAASAYHLGRHSLFIYENGIGAINLPYTKAQVGLDQAKSVHPLSLLHVSEFLSRALNGHFQVNNPFWLWTKAQMVESLIKTKGADLISLSSSCDRVHRLDKGITQCGVCTSCLLRRQSLSALGVNDLTDYDFKRIDKNNPPIRAMQYQVNRIRYLLLQPDPWVSLSRDYHELDDIVDQISLQTIQEAAQLRMQIIKLYSNYVDEWRLFEENIERMQQVS